MFAGLILSITVIGAITGIWMFIIGLIARLGIGQVDYSPAKYDVT